MNKLVEDLNQEAVKLRLQLKEYGSEDPSSTDNYNVKVHDLGPSMEDAALELSELDRDQAIVASLETRLREIENTVARIKKGAYGKCEKCAQNIAPARLKVIPAASLCIDCANKANLL